MYELWIEFCSGILKVSPYIFYFFEKDLRGTQRSEKDKTKIAIAVMHLFAIVHHIFLRHTGRWMYERLTI